MKLKRYCVTVLDHWTPTQEFWTLEGAKKHLRKHQLSRANLFQWEDGAWHWMCGARECEYPKGCLRDDESGWCPLCDEDGADRIAEYYSDKDDKADVPESLGE